MTLVILAVAPYHNHNCSVGGACKSEAECKLCREALLGGFVMSDAALTRYAIEVIVTEVPGALAYVLRT